MRSTPLTSCSTGTATDCSTASADAPGYVAVTRMLGGARNGYCSTDRPRMITTPNMTIRIEMTIETIGRLIKKFPIALASFLFSRGIAGCGCGGGLYFTSRSGFLHALDDDPLSPVEPIEHDVIVICLVAKSHTAHLHLVLLIDDHYRLGALQLLDRTLWDQYRIFLRGDGHTYAGKLTGPDVAVGISKRSFCFERSGLWINSAVQHLERSRNGMHTVVGEN